MKAKRKWIWLLLLVPVAGVSWQIYDHFRYWPTPAKAGSTIYAEVGYEALRPTLDYLAPGVLYTVEKRGEGFVNLRPTCEVDDGALTNAIQVRRTTDVSSTITRKLSAGIDVPRENWSKLTLNANLEGVQNIKVVYSNSRVELLSTEKIRALRESYLKQASCSAAVEFELEHGYMVCQTDAAIVSDLVYELTRGASNSIAGGGDVGHIIEAATHGATDNSATTKIQGSKMYHAVKLHNSCMLLNKTALQSDQSHSEL